MQIRLNQGLFRSIRFARPESSTCHIDITTWPNHLCISGDMGCYVFSRTPDMFDFFRGARINPSYWSEKVQAESRFGEGVTKFDAEAFMVGFKDRVADHLVDLDITDDQRQLIEELAADEFRCVNEDNHTYCDKAYNFSFSNLDLPEELQGIKFPNWQVDEFWTMEKFTFHFIWVCYAIVWAIQKFDEHAGANAGTKT